MIGEKSVSEAEEQHAQNLCFSIEAEKEVCCSQVGVDDGSVPISEGRVYKAAKEPETKEPEAISAHVEEDTASRRRKRPLRTIPKRLLQGCGYSTKATPVMVAPNVINLRMALGKKDDSPGKTRPKRARLVKQPFFCGSYKGTGGDAVA